MRIDPSSAVREWYLIPDRLAAICCQRQMVMVVVKYAATLQASSSVRSEELSQQQAQQCRVSTRRVLVGQRSYELVAVAHVSFSLSVLGHCLSSFLSLYSVQQK